MRYAGFYMKGRTAVLQIKDDKDYLSPELFDYYETVSTKADIKRRLNATSKKNCITYLQAKHPGLNIKNLRIE